jgi:hypothetical protein
VCNKQPGIESGFLLYRSEGNLKDCGEVSAGKGTGAFRWLPYSCEAVCKPDLLSGFLLWNGRHDVTIAALRFGMEAEHRTKRGAKIAQNAPIEVEFCGTDRKDLAIPESNQNPFSWKANAFLFSQSGHLREFDASDGYLSSRLSYASPG